MFETSCGTSTLVESRVAGLDLELDDNGAGIDLQRVRDLCQRRGVEVIPGCPLAELLFLPVFSTTKTLTASSGRGVGVAALKQLADKHQGSITLDNPGRCTWNTFAASPSHKEPCGRKCIVKQTGRTRSATLTGDSAPI